MDNNLINEVASRFTSTPVVRCGDILYFLDKDYAPSSFSDSNLNQDIERRTLAMGHYRCPFDFLTEFQQWFEWQRRVHFDKQTTGQATTDMISDVARIKSNKIEREIMFTVSADFSPIYHSVGVFHGSAS